MNDNHAYLVCGFCGILFYMFSAYRSLKTDAEKANVSLSFKQYLKGDWPGHACAILPVVIWFFTFGEAVRKYPALQDYARISFAIMGALGSWAFQKVLSKSKTWIRTVVDDKTNELEQLKADCNP